MIKTIIGILLSIMSFAIWALPNSGGLGSDGAEVENSVIENKAEGEFTASDNSTINAGINIPASNVKDSILTNQTRGNINAQGNSRVNTGLDVNGAVIRNSSVSTSSDVEINASSSTVTTGVEASEIRNSRVSTNVNAEINAENSNVDVGAVKGNIENKKITTNVTTAVDAKDKSVSVGSVYVNGDHFTISPGGSASVSNSSGIGNVVVESDKVKEVNTTVGNAGKIGQSAKTKHMSEYYKDEGGVAPDGTKYIYVSGQQERAAERGANGGNAGNTVIDRDSKVKKVNTYVE